MLHSRRLLILLVAALVAPAGAARKPSPPKSARQSGYVRRWMRALTLREKVAQLIFIPFHGAAPNTRSREYRKFVKLVRDTRVGGMVLVNWSNGRVTQKAHPYALAAFLNRMQKLARVPLLVAGDFERGASMRVDGTTVFPQAMAFGAAGDPALVRFEGQVTAREARAIGVQWLFFPVADVNNNPDNPIINIRSYGEDPKQVSAMVTAFIEGTRADPHYRVLTTAKHFPGHGDTSVDTHLNMAVINATREQLQNIELPPFRAAIQAGVDAIMTAHIAVPALAPADVPATLSPAILTGLLRGEMGFKGIIVTDALEMGGIAQGYSGGEAAVQALAAGADALVMPPDPEAAIRAILAAVQSGRLTRARIDESVARLLAAKERMGLDRRRAVGLEAISDQIDMPEDQERAQEIADRAITLVKNDGSLVPLRAPAKTCFLTLAESHYSSEGLAFAQEVRRRVHDATVISLDASLPGAALDAAVQKTAGCDTVAVAAFASVAAYRGDLALGGDFPRMLDALFASGKPVALIALGNPYLVRSFPKAAAFLLTFSTVPTSEIAAVKALFAESPITGRLPVTIPGVAKIGEGIQLPAGQKP
ncbi:MAG TPA: glycoside hydrolase family 3 N-terminal domain-containing protein [Bryobacteraceae bacterium]|nr:glycoside hydrolase family 3 N-terminal domain-containing protein [Bryobacteraceae bacterium]